MIKLRYANYPKDYFMGMLPSSQYGSVSVLPGTDSSLDPSIVRSYLSTDNPTGVNSLTVAANSSSVTVTGTNANQRSVRINSDLSALPIRATEYLQRWKEVVQFSSKDYRSDGRPIWY